MITTNQASNLRRDPTRTGRIRRAMIREIRKRFSKFKRDLVELIDQKDVMGLRVTANIDNREWELRTDPQKVEEFGQWLSEQEGTGGAGEDVWKKYIDQGYAKGAGRAYTQWRNKSKHSFSGEGENFDKGRQTEFLRGMLGAPESVEKLQGLASRVLTDLKGVDAVLDTQLRRVLTDGLARSSNPRVIARDLVKQTNINRRRAETIARTEIIRAHAEGQLDALERVGVDTVGVEVEFSHSGDNRVCPQCQPLGGQLFKIKKARGVIPVHPNCRCAFIPAVSGPPPKASIPKPESQPQPRSKPKKKSSPPKTSGITAKSLRQRGINIASETFEGLNKEEADKIFRLINEYENDFPGIFKFIQIKAVPLGVDVPGTFRREGGSRSLLFSTDALKKPAALKKTVKQAYKEGWLAGDTVEHLIHHEIGHLIDFTPFAKQQKLIKLRLAKKYLRNNPPSRDDLSGYARTSKEELFAEAWGAIRSKKKLTKWEKGFKQAFIDDYKERGKDIPKWLM